MEEYKSEEEALIAASKIFGIPFESIKVIQPKKMLYEFPIYRMLEVYEIKEKRGFGISWTRYYRGEVLYGLWLIDGEKIERV